MFVVLLVVCGFHHGMTVGSYFWKICIHLSIFSYQTFCVLSSFIGLLV